MGKNKRNFRHVLSRFVRIQEMNPKKVLLFCGKRKSGKDFLTEWLCNHLNTEENDKQAVIVRLSGPLKQCYADNHGLDFQKLLDASDYKEKHRKDMIAWSEKIRNKDPSYFCLKAIDYYKADQYPIWIISDCRRKTDFQFFDSKFTDDKTMKIRIWASEEVRVKRGFSFQGGVDDAESECGLDDHENFDFIVENNGTVEPYELLKNVVNSI